MARDPPAGYTEKALSSTARHGQELSALGGKLAELVASLDGPEEPDGLRARLAEIEAENRRLCEEFVAVEEHHAQLVVLYVAAERLHEVRTVAEARTAIQEVLVNLVGTEHFALFERDRADALVPTFGLGLDWRALPAIVPGEGPLGRAVAEDRIELDERSARPPGAPLASIPLRGARGVVGAVAIHGLVGHKPALTEFDDELFALLQRHGGLALCAGAGR
jgi:hypothetical protein